MQRQLFESEGVSAAELIDATGISLRKLVRLRQSGIVFPLAPRQGRGRGRGTTPLKYPAVAAQTINRYEELEGTVDERRRQLWLECYSVRIAPDLADILGPSRTARSIKTLDDIETKIVPPLLEVLAKQRANSARMILRDVSEDDLRALITTMLCLGRGIRLPLFDEPNPYPINLLMRRLGLPGGLPQGFFDAFPHMHEQLRQALLTASAEELKYARAACRFLSRLFDDPQNSRRDTIEIDGQPLPSRMTKFSSLLWQSPVVLAATVGLVIIGIRAYKSAFGEQAAAIFASTASRIRVSLATPTGIDHAGRTENYN